jgi:hypothetical protein
VNSARLFGLAAGERGFAEAVESLGFPGGVAGLSEQV